MAQDARGRTKGGQATVTRKEFENSVEQRLEKLGVTATGAYQGYGGVPRES